MSGVLPEATILGALRLTDVFVHYDVPRLFGCESHTQRFIAVWVDEDDESETYVYAPVSAARYMSVRSGLMPLREALEGPEDGFVFVVQLMSDGSATVGPTPAADLDEKWLPDAGATLSVDTATTAPFRPDDLGAVALAEGRTQAAIRLAPESLPRTEYSLRGLGELMRLTQETVDALAQELDGRPTARGRIPNHILDQTELVYTGVAAASFVYSVAPLSRGALFESPLVRDALARLLEVLASGSGDPENVRAGLEGLQLRSITKLRDLLERVTQDEAGFSVYVAVPGEEVRSVEVDRATVHLMLSVARQLDQSSVTREHITGRLIGVNLRTRVYELVEVQSDSKYAGHIMEDALSQVRGATVGELYDAVIRTELEVSSVTGEEKRKRLLESLEPTATMTTLQ